MIVTCDQKGVKTAATIIKNGGLVVFPTDTVYGLGCDPRNPEAVQSIFRIKKRVASKQLPILGYSKTEIAKIAIFDDISNKIADRFWPGPLTLVLKIKDVEVSKALNSDGKIAVRVPNNSCALLLLKECQLLVGTSANFSGMPAFSDPEKLQESFSGYDVLLDGGTIPPSASSTIVEVVKGKLKILRQGKITKKEILSIL
jgi:L-threonylcarbamoyladenylate synthase